MNKESVWESGASSYKVHDLILFADNTSVLADAKFEVIKRFKKCTKQNLKKGDVVIDLKKFNRLKLMKELYPFAEQVAIMYKQQVRQVRFTHEELEEFCLIAAEEVI
jgi:hypothetical protein